MLEALSLTAKSFDPHPLVFPTGHLTLNRPPPDSVTSLSSARSLKAYLKVLIIFFSFSIEGSLGSFPCRLYPEIGYLTLFCLSPPQLPSQTLTPMPRPLP